MNRTLPLAALAANLIFSTFARNLTPIDPKLAPDLFVWSDTCNVYVLRDGETALLIDLGDGGVLDHLREIGVQRVEWVLFTHHHREQCQGAPRLRSTGTRVAAPEARGSYPIRVKSAAGMSPGVRIVALDATIDGRRYGEQFDFVVGIATDLKPKVGEDNI